MLQLGWKAGPEQYPPTELCDYAVAAEQAGFDSIDVSDHFHPWSEAGKDPASMPRLIEINVAYGGDIQAAIQEQLKYWAGTYVPALFDQKIYSPTMSQENGEVIGADVVKKTGCFSTDPGDHVKFVKQYVDLGFNVIFFHSSGPDQAAFLERYGREVLPALRR